MRQFLKVLFLAALVSVAVCTLPLVAANGCHSLAEVHALLIAMAFLVTELRLSCYAACEII